MSDETKRTRKRLTVTAMYEAINDLFFATIPEAEQEKYHPCEISIRKHRTGPDDLVYRVELLACPVGATKRDLVDTVDHAESAEAAVSILLANMQEVFEHHRAEVLRSIDTVLQKHHGALRGARSKIRGKKA